MSDDGCRSEGDTEAGVGDDESAPPAHGAAETARAALPNESLTDEMRTLLADLLSENDRLGAELSAARRRIGELERLAVEDSLVPVLNRRGFMRELERAISYVARHHVPAALVFLDLDRFKGVNDRHGHSAGDATLRHCGMILRRSIRASDTIGRIGGDEFAIILWNASPTDATAKARQLTAQIEAQALEHEGVPIRVGASAGATAISGWDTPEAVLQRADLAMYDSKRQRLGESRSV